VLLSFHPAIPDHSLTQLIFCIYSEGEFAALIVINHRDGEHTFSKSENFFNHLGLFMMLEEREGER
jgi:hypothetical protein